MSRDELLQLRQEIVGYSRTLALQNGGDPATKLEVLMSLIRSGDVSHDIMSAAYKAAQDLPDNSIKLDAMLDLVYVIDAELAGDEPGEDGADETPPSAPSESVSADAILEQAHGN